MVWRASNNGVRLRWSVPSLAHAACGFVMSPDYQVARCHAGLAGSLASQGATPPSVAHSLPSNVELSPGNLLPPLTALSSTVPGLMSPTAEVWPGTLTCLVAFKPTLPLHQSDVLKIQCFISELAVKHWSLSRVLAWDCIQVQFAAQACQRLCS